MAGKQKKAIGISTKLTALIGGVIALCCASVATISLSTFSTKQIKATETQLIHSAEGASLIMEDWLVTVNGYAAISSLNADVVRALNQGNAGALKTEIAGYTEYLDYDFMAFVDKRGVVLAGGEDGFNPGTNLSSSVLIQNALKGNPSEGFEKDLGGVCDFCAACAYPVKDGSRVIGATIFCYDLTKPDFIELMQKSYDAECTIFSGDTRVQSTLEGVIGTKLDNQKIIAQVLEGGGQYTGENTIKGKRYFSIYSPLKNNDGTIAGMLFIAKSLEDIRAIQIDTLKFVIPVSIVLCIILLVLSYLFVRWLMWRISNVTKQLEEMSTGEADLTKRVTLRVVDEIGLLVINFNKFCDKLQQIIAETKKSKDELSVSGESTVASIHDTSSAITQIIANIESISNQIKTQSGSVQQTAGAVDQISSNIESLNRMIDNQSSGVSQASAAVEEMIGNISSVNHSVEKMAQSFIELESNANTGFKKQNDVNDRILQIEQQSEMLQEANTAISSIAEQTNLLAMNAAIEAAHAGEAGKGFAVVADEIRKLSETSSAQSKTIGEQLNNIKTSIGEVVSASNESSKSFSVVSQKISETDQLVMQIKAAMEEQNQGSKQITDALKTMNDSTEEVKSASLEMTNGNQLILDEVKHLQSATLAMKESMDEMSVGAKKINETGANLAEIAGHTSSAIQKIGKQIDLFRT